MKNMKLQKALIIALVTLIVISVGTVGTLAYIHSKAGAIENKFVPGSIDGQINETIEGAVKKDVKVKNTGKSPAYVRVALVVEAFDAENNLVAMPNLTLDDAFDVTGLDSNTAWVKGNDGYYYHKAIVEPTASTTALFASATVDSTFKSTLPAGVNVSLTVVAELIQKNAVEEAWGKTLTNGELTPNNN